MTRAKASTRGPRHPWCSSEWWSRDDGGALRQGEQDDAAPRPDKPQVLGVAGTEAQTSAASVSRVLLRISGTSARVLEMHEVDQEDGTEEERLLVDAHAEVELQREVVRRRDSVHNVYRNN